MEGHKAQRNSSRKKDRLIARLPESCGGRVHAVSVALTISTDLMEPSSPQGRVPGALPPLRLSIA